MTADEDLSTAKAAMLSRESMPWFILHTFQGCSETLGVWAALCGYAGAINAPSSCIRAFLVGASVGFVWQDCLQPLLQSYEAAELHTQDQKPFLYSVCSVFLLKGLAMIRQGGMGHKSQSNSYGVMPCFSSFSLRYSSQFISFMAGAWNSSVPDSC